MMPKVSVIVPVYDVEKFLPRCLNSLQNQTLQHIEIILVDDESPDNCPAMCDMYQKQDERIKVIHKKNGGLGYARNSGMEIATGEYIAFVDSDDYVELDSYETMYRLAKAYNVDIVKAEKINEGANGEITNKVDKFLTREGYFEGEELRGELLYPIFGMLPNEGGDRYATCSCATGIYRHEFLDMLNIKFDSEKNFISEDLLFMLKVLGQAESAYVVNKRFYHYIVNDKSLTHVYRPDRFKKEIILYNECINRLIQMGYYSKCKIRLYRHLLIRTRKAIKRELIGNPQKKQAVNNVREMLKCEEIQKVFEKYDASALPIKYKIIYYMMKYRLVWAMKILKTKL